jgi:hypothetical protein
MVTFIASYAGHKVDKDGESVIKLTASMSEIGEISRLPIYMDKQLKVTIEVVED